MGESASYLGTNISVIVLPLIAVLSIHASVLQMGVLGTLQFAPYFFLGPLAGIIADRHRRRLIGILANVGRTALLCSLTLLAVTGFLGILNLYVITLLVGSLGVFFDAAFWPFVHSVVQESDLLEANSKLISTQSAASIMGPGIGGVLVGLITAPFAVAANALSFSFSALQLARIEIAEAMPKKGARETHLREELAKGFHVVFRSRVLLALLGEATTYNIFFQMILTVFFIFAARQLEMSPYLIGSAFSVGGVGALAGAFLVPRLTMKMAVGSLLIAAMFLGNSAWLLLTIVRGPTLFTFPVIALMFFLDGIGNGVANVLTISIRQLVIPKEILASGMASSRTIGYGVVPLGAFFGGILGFTIGIWPTLVLGAIGVFVSTFWVLFSPVPRVKSLSSRA